MAHKSTKITNSQVKYQDNNVSYECGCGMTASGSTQSGFVSRAPHWSRPCINKVTWVTRRLSKSRETYAWPLRIFSLWKDFWVTSVTGSHPGIHRTIVTFVTCILFHSFLTASACPLLFPREQTQKESYPKLEEIWLFYYYSVLFIFPFTKHKTFYNN